MRTTQKTITLVIADNSYSELLITANIMRSIGCRVITALSSEQAISLAQIHLPDAVILGLEMSGMPSLVACRILKASTEVGAIPVIFVSGINSADARVAAFTAGGVDVITKPVDPRELEARIRIHVPGLRAFSFTDRPDSTERSRNPDKIVVQAAKDIIAANLQSLPTTAEIARQVGTYRERLSALFSRIEGTTISAFIRQEKIRQAKELLSRSTLQIREVANLVGFDSAANFATCFREVTGESPSFFRNRNNSGFDAEFVPDYSPVSNRTIFPSFISNTFTWPNNNFDNICRFI